MLGATDTSKGPEVAPAGMVMLSDVLLQVLTVTAAPFSSTALPPCGAPNPEPDITTWLPMDPVVADTAVITGAGAAAELTDTLSNVAVANDDVVRLLTASPTYTFGTIVTVWLVPNCTQFTPSAELYIVNTFPLLASFTQYGNAPLPNDWYELLAPVLVRSVMYMLEEYSNSYTWFAPGFSVSRIMIPACVALPCKLTTRATIVPSPFSDW